MSALQLGLVVVAIVLVVGVVLYNRWEEQRVRRRLRAGGEKSHVEGEGSRRVEPTMTRGDDDFDAAPPAGGVAPTQPFANADVAHDPDWRAPMDGVVRLPEAVDQAGSVDDVAADASRPTASDALRRARTSMPAQTSVAAPDPDIETLAIVQPAKPVAAGTLAAGLHARLGKPVRWYGRRDTHGPWQRLAAESGGEYSELAACLLLADRNGPATQAQIESFHKLAGEIAASLPGAWSGPSPSDEAQRADALDRLCAELDMQIGLTVRKVPPAIIAGTRLRGVAEASGFRLAPTGRFEWVQDDTGVVLFTLQSMTDEPFTADSLRQGATPGVIFLLDVPRVADPPRAFDQMKMAAKRMAHTVGGELVDDNGRPLNDAGLAAIREQVVTADSALRRYNIEPGSPRALKLFAA